MYQRRQGWIPKPKQRHIPLSSYGSCFPCVGIILRYTCSVVESMGPGHSRPIRIRKSLPFPQVPTRVSRKVCCPHPRTHSSSQECLVLCLARPGADEWGQLHLNHGGWEQKSTYYSPQRCWSGETVVSYLCCPLTSSSADAQLLSVVLGWKLGGSGQPRCHCCGPVWITDGLVSSVFL